MGTTYNSHKFTEFWKIPSDLVVYNDEVADKRGNCFRISMPPPDEKGKYGLFHWEDAYFFVSTTGDISGNTSISALVNVNPTTSTISLPFNFDQVVDELLIERYTQQESNHHLVHFSRHLYYKIKPYLPRNIQVQLRQKAVDQMRHRKFPRWEIETSVDLLRRNLLSKILEIHPGASLPIISLWPQGAETCLVLTHDVETISGVKNIERIINIEKKLGFRSVWNFVPERYPIDLSLLQELQAFGFEVGVHGLYHDGKLFDSYEVFQNRAEIINQYLKQWGCVGFRSPSNLRNLDWISKHIDADYDSSCVSTEWYGAQPGGCCTAFPFIHDDLVELPITLQQDFTLLQILKLNPQETLEHWNKTIKSIREINGLILINIHPDYMTSDDRLALYENFLYTVKQERNCWHALPKDVACWWVDRNDSELTISGAGWEITGPASDRGIVMKTNLDQGKLCFFTN